MLRYKINCGLTEKEPVKCREKFDRIHEKLKEEGWKSE